MMSFRIPAVIAAALVAMPLAAAAPAAAPAAPAPQQAPSNKPIEPTFSKDFGDWTVRCFPGNSPTPCQMVQLRIVQKTNQRILGVLLAYVPSKDASLMEFSVPLGVALQNGLVIDTNTYKSGVLKFTRCDQQGCYVEGAVAADVLDAMARATSAKVQIVSMNGKKYQLVFSTKGFTEARRAMIEQAKNKGGSAPAETAPQQ